MFHNRITQADVDSIVIDREFRQRSEITKDSILDLAASIARSNWISPLLVDETTNTLVAGERRLTAVRALRAAMNGDFSGFTDEAAARALLYPICTCKVPSWKDWTKIPVQYGSNLTQRDLAVYEFIENAHRKDLPWQDRAKAIYAIHAHGLKDNSDWTLTHTAQACGVSNTVVQENLKLWRIVENESDPKLLSLIKDAQSIGSAKAAVERYISRREPDEVSLSGNVLVRVQTATIPTGLNKPAKAKAHDQSDSDGRPLKADVSWSDELPSLAQASLSEQLLINADFHEWATSYTGEPFNFIHCDFPYGINFNKGEQAGTVANAALGEYDDSEDVYWALLNSLRDNSARLIAPSCHIMFWFSQNFRRETEDFFVEMGGVVQPFLMIWHCADGDGILPDPQRYGRRTYETAMLVTFGDRKIAAPRAISFAHPRESKTRIHRSQKPLSVLEHFFSMFVDDSSRVLDPTAGSATSLLAAYRSGAAEVIGLELDPKLYRAAARFIDEREDHITL